MRAMTSDDDDEIINSIWEVLQSTDRYGLIHESVNSFDASQWTRSWFGWGNAVFGQAIMEGVIAKVRASSPRDNHPQRAVNCCIALNTQRQHSELQLADLAAMADLVARDLPSWPIGANENDTIISGVHFNVTTLNYWNYTLYEGNWTLSNGSYCYLIDQPYTPPLLLSNGTFVNSTWCYLATLPSSDRAHTGIGFAVAFALSLIFVLINLTRHGKLYLPAEKRFYAIGRRWQWYWASFICATALIGLFTGIDVDRYRVVELPLVLNVFFWFLMNMGSLALVWEAVRHWGSWMERQFIDPNPFVLQQTDRRGMFEFWLPLWFYLWWWLDFFVVIPRNWGAVELQRSPEQTIENAIPAATDIRFKIAPFLLLVSWLTILVSLWHSVRHYEARNRGWLNRIIGFLRYVPFRFLLMIPLALVVVAYQALAAWEFDYSPLKRDTNLVAMYVGGYLPALLLVIILCVSGFMRPNEDKELIRQRRERGAQLDQELGITKKPAWWRRIRGDVGTGDVVRDQLYRNVREVSGNPRVQQMAEQRAANSEAAPAGNNTFEMSSLGRSSSIANRTAPPPYSPPSRSDQRNADRTIQAAAGLLFPNASNPPPPAPIPTTAPAPAGNRGRNTVHTRASADRSSSTGSAVSITGPPQKIRSMLDV
ncbi:hypothetical protein NUW58_g8808 [Xylaria curta]|uniref:Uncharacterized protein n=1 Tax=Xylaria curta TaxID=42375 RepID=A0ACC1N3W0_9PEZI|nr:hypothetical protein NUW58_g8808 [Xylaria curta]